MSDRYQAHLVERLQVLTVTNRRLRNRIHAERRRAEMWRARCKALGAKVGKGRPR